MNVSMQFAIQSCLLHVQQEPYSNNSVVWLSYMLDTGLVRPVFSPFSEQERTPFRVDAINAKYLILSFLILSLVWNASRAVTRSEPFVCAGYYRMNSGLDSSGIFVASCVAWINSELLPV